LLIFKARRTLIECGTNMSRDTTLSLIPQKVKVEGRVVWPELRAVTIKSRKFSESVFTGCVL